MDRPPVPYVLLISLVSLLAGCRTLPFSSRADTDSTINNESPPTLATRVSSNSIERLPAVESRPVQPAAFLQGDDDADHKPESEVLRLPSQEAPPDSTLEELEQLALASNPAVAFARSNVEAARGKWVQAGLPPNPTIGYLADEMGDDGTAGKQGGFTGQQFVTGHKLRLDRAVASQEIARVEQQLTIARQRVLTDVRVAYYSVVIAQRRLDFARELLSVSEKAVDASRKLIEAKEISRVALLQTEVEAQNARIILRRAENESIAAWRDLTSVIGNPRMQPRQLTGDLNAIAHDLQWDEELTRLVSASPEVAEAVAELERSRWALNRAFAERKPNVDLEVAVQYDNVTKDTLTGVLVGLPVPIWNRNQGAIREARGNVVAAEWNVERVELGLRQRLAIEFQRYADARYQVDNLANSILPKAKETFDIVTRGYQRGEVGYLELLAAQRSYFETNLSYFDALRELWQAKLRIDGMLLDGSLQEPAAR